TITVSASATDNVGVVGLQFKLDGVNLGAEDTTAPYSISWNTTPASSGSHTLTAVARDAAGNTTTSTAVSVTVADIPPVPGLSGLQPMTVTAGSPGLTLSVQGSGFRSSSQVAVNGTTRTTTFVSSSALQTTFSASEVATAGTSYAVTVVTPPVNGQGGGTSNALTLAVVGGPSLTRKGGCTPVTVGPGATVSVEVANGQGTPKDWLALYTMGAADSAYLDWFFLNGTKAPPAVGLTTATVTFTLPTTPRAYEVRFFLNNTNQRLGATPTIVVNPAQAAAVN